LQRKSVEVFLPTVSKWSRWNDRKKRVEWPLFPGYCFAHFDAADRLQVLTCDGVVQILGIEGVPSPIPASQVEGIRQLVDSELAYDPCPLVREGDMVKLVSGPLKGVVGRLVRKGAHARLMLAVDLIGQAVSVEVDAADVRPY
jgi:transcription antitermination factor NusG